MPKPKRKTNQDKAADLAARFDVEVADGQRGESGENRFLNALAVLLLDIATKQAARAPDKSAG